MLAVGSVQLERKVSSVILFGGEWGGRGAESVSGEQVRWRLRELLSEPDKRISK